MENLIIEKTVSSPTIQFNCDGTFLIEGRSLPENAHKLFEPVYEWMKHFHSDKVNFHIKLDYLNTSSSLELFSLLKKLNEDEEIIDITVIWHYEEDDEDHFETGLTYGDQLQRIKFEFLKEHD